ncbi:uncharacterized protein [Parasteatoda tepidariorum]|uniref:uncharacterized protein n=1 Tax=Parasteatoda tepidariorum TaxID=114398 RepID=UPI001C71FFFE|nr:uncharacterized protein LOC122269332 [Parasteatoda tepidariorum]
MTTVQQWKEETLSNLLKGYNPSDIFNDETGLFFNLLPIKTLTIKGENCHGGKLSKMRLTVLLCANADGSRKLTSLVIGRAEKPRLGQCRPKVRIINGFIKAGFSISEEESAVVLEEEEGSVSEVEDLLEVDDAYTYCDTDIINSEIPSISDLMPDSDDRADDDEDEITEDVPTANQAIQSIKTLEQFLLANVNQEANLENIVSIERAVYEIVAKNEKQVKITHFFH